MTENRGSLRRATESDASEIAALYLRSRRSAKGIPPSVHGDDEVGAWIHDVLRRHEVWVTTSGDELAAMMVLNGDWVEQVYVAPDRARKGFGSELLDMAKTTRSELSLWTFEANSEARSFYEKHGFTQAGPPSSDNEEHEPAICYRWRREESSEQ